MSGASLASVKVGDGVLMKLCHGSSSGLEATVQTRGRWTVFTCWRVLRFV